MTMIYKLNIYHAFTEIYECFNNTIVLAFMQRDNNSHADNNCTSTDDRNEEWNTKTRSRTKKERTDCIKRRKISSKDMQPTLYDRPKRIRREPAKYMG